MARSDRTGGASPKKKNRKHGRNREKCARYRARVGRPNGPGMPGSKRPARART